MMKCNKKNCPLVGNNENCDIRDCKWRTEDASDNELIRRGDAIDEVNNLTYPSSLADVKRKLMAIPAVEPCKDAISREYALGVIYPSNTYPSRADIYKALKDAPSVTVEPKHGEWSFIGDNTFECSHCGIVYSTKQFDAIRNYTTDPFAPEHCPKCGARMKGADSEHDK